jgi:hypothetical protein
MRTPKLIAVTGMVTGLCASAMLWAAECPLPHDDDSLFRLSACANNQVAFITGSTVEEIINQFDTAALKQHFPTYNDAVDATSFYLDFRGVPMYLSSAQNSSSVRFVIDKLHIDKTFAGATRDDSMNGLEDYIKKEGDKILAELMRVSAVEPVAGNPSSMEAQMVDAAFADAVLDNSSVNTATSQLGIGMRFGRYSLSNKDLSLFSLPLAYTKKLTSGDTLMLRLPISYSIVDNAKSYRVALGMSYKRVINERWALTPGFDYGVVGSPDLGSVGQIISGSLTSDLSLYSDAKVRVGMGNMVGYYQTLPFSFDDYNLGAEVTNVMFRNGLLVSVPLQAKVLGQSTSVDIYLVDTRFTGDELYTDNYQEFGVVFGPRKQFHQLSTNASSQIFGVGFKYLYAGGDNDINGFEVAFNYRF